jgi:hypothetical protein
VFEVVKANVDGYGIDSYDSFPPANVDVGTHLNGFGYLTESFAYARANGKLLALPEWGLACNTAGCLWADSSGGDDPLYIITHLRFMKRHAAAMAFDAYFNESAGYTSSQLNPATTWPQSRIAYRTFFRHNP